MTITFLDSATTNKDDLDWSLFERLGAVTKYDLTEPEQVLDRLKGAEIIVTNKVKIRREHFETNPQLKLICVLATGYDIIDIEAAGEYGVSVCNVPGYSSDSVAQVVFALLLELTHAVGEHSRAVHAGEWTNSPTFSFWKQPLIELAGKTFLVVGYGSIGQKVAKIAEAFEMQVMISSLRKAKHDPPYPQLELRDALPQADVVSLHCPLTEETKGVINSEWLGLMKPDSLLINTARGGLIDEVELADALARRQIAGYAADVLSTEPPEEDNPLLTAPNCILTPHYAWASYEARKRLWEATAENIRRFLEGKPINLVSRK